MPSISTTDAQGLFTKTLADVYKQKIATTGFLRSFFPSKEVPTLEVSIEVQRGFEKTAVDVVRGTDGNRNTFTRSSEKIFIPPYYREYFDATKLQLYDRLYGATTITDAIFSAYIESVADSMMELQKKIERSYELQCANVLEDGTVSLQAQTSIDFKRKTESMVDKGAGAYWATGTVDPFKDLENGCIFLRTKGKTTAQMYDCILGSTALSDLLTNTKFLARQNLFSMALDQVNSPQMNSEGATYHGTLTCGSYKVRLWAYPQYYDLSGVSTPYVNPKKITLIPENPQFKLAFAAVPQLITPNTLPRMGAFIMSESVDQRGRAHLMEIESAGVAIPTAIDQIYTLKVVA